MRVSNPENSACTEYRPGASFWIVATPCSVAFTGSIVAALLRGLDARDGHGGARQHRAGGIDDGDDERAGLRGCLRVRRAPCARWTRAERRVEQRQSRVTSVTDAERIIEPHFAVVSKRRGSTFALIR